MALICRFDHLHLRSDDAEAAARFYVEVLGGRETDRVPVPGGLRLVLELAGQQLFIEQAPADTARASRPPHVGLEHLGLCVEDLDAAERDLARHGVRFLDRPVRPRPGIRYAFIEGPDRVLIEILERREE